MNNEVQIIKLADVITTPKSSVIMTACEDDSDIIKYYLSVLRKYKSNILKTGKGIVRQPSWSKFNVFTGLSDDPLIGISDGDPIIGQSFTINNSSWHTSKVLEIIEDNIIVTKNSIYLIYNKSNHRDRVIRDLGL